MNKLYILQDKINRLDHVSNLLLNNNIDNADNVDNLNLINKMLKYERIYDNLGGGKNLLKVGENLKQNIEKLKNKFSVSNFNVNIKNQNIIDTILKKIFPRELCKYIKNNNNLNVHNIHFNIIKIMTDSISKNNLYNNDIIYNLLDSSKILTLGELLCLYDLFKINNCIVMDNHITIYKNILITINNNNDGNNNNNDENNKSDESDNYDNINIINNNDNNNNDDNINDNVIMFKNNILNLTTINVKDYDLILKYVLNIKKIIETPFNKLKISNYIIIDNSHSQTLNIICNLENLYQDFRYFVKIYCINDTFGIIEGKIYNATNLLLRNHTPNIIKIYKTEKVKKSCKLLQNNLNFISRRGTLSFLLKLSL